MDREVLDAELAALLVPADSLLRDLALAPMALAFTSPNESPTKGINCVNGTLKQKDGARCVDRLGTQDNIC